MIILGTIRFHTGKGRFLYHLEYYSKEQRQEEIDSFISKRKRLRRLAGAYYQIIPFVSEQREFPQIMPADQPKQKIERPPAIYDNSNGLYKYD